MVQTDGDRPAAVRGLPPVPMGRRPSTAALLLAGTLFVTGGATAAVMARGTPLAEPAAKAAASATRTAEAATTSGQLARAEAVEPLLAGRDAAVRTGRPASWVDGLDPAAAAFRAHQITVLGRIRLLPLTRWHEELVDTAPGPETGGTPTFVAHVRLHYRLPGDTRDIVCEQYLTVTERAGHWVLSSDADPRTEPALWDLGPLTVERGSRCVVIGLGRAPGRDPVLDRTVVETDAAAVEVDRVWGPSGPRTAVVVLPGSRSLMAAALGRQDGSDLDQLAAVTSGELVRGTGPGSTGSGTVDGGTADRVVLNPGPFARLTALGRRVVLTHELTHVATRATARLSPPLWVEEGFANYVAYRDAGLAPGVIASDVLGETRAGTAPQHLPVAGDFDPASGPIAPAYADAWLAFELMARRDGAGGPVAFYRVAAGLSAPGGPSGSAVSGEAVQLAFRQVLGTTQSAFEAAWRAYRATVAGAGARS